MSPGHRWIVVIGTIAIHFLCTWFIFIHRNYLPSKLIAPAVVSTVAFLLYTLAWNLDADQNKKMNQGVQMHGSTAFIPIVLRILIFVPTSLTHLAVLLFLMHHHNLWQVGFYIYIIACGLTSMGNTIELESRSQGLHYTVLGLGYTLQTIYFSYTVRGMKVKRFEAIVNRHKKKNLPYDTNSTDSSGLQTSN